MSCLFVCTGLRCSSHQVFVEKWQWHAAPCQHLYTATLAEARSVYHLCHVLHRVEQRFMRKLSNSHTEDALGKSKS